MRKLPRKQVIMGAKYKVSRPKKLSMEGHEENAGCSDDSDFTIEVKAGISGKAAWDAFSHEWGHCVLSVTGLNQRMSEELEEAVAQSFGSALREFCEQQGLKLE